MWGRRRPVYCVLCVGAGGKLPCACGAGGTKEASTCTPYARHGYGTAAAWLHVNTGGVRVALARGVVCLIEDGEDLVGVRG